jgi:hypothetical protein
MLRTIFATGPVLFGEHGAAILMHEVPLAGMVERVSFS